MSAWNIWLDDPPPRETWIRAKWRWMDDDGSLIVRTCKRGCCVQEPHLGSMTLPKFWLPATPEEIACASPSAAKGDGK